MEVPVTGACDPRFAPVHEAFATSFAERGEVGAAVCVLVDGEVVVDLVGGWADAERTRPWTHDTLVNAYSAGKGVLATLALQLVDAGDLALDAPLGDVWPQLAEGGAERATLRQALCHQAGLPAIRRPLTDDDVLEWDTMASALAATEPWWVPGERHAYHPNTYGHLVGEVVHRVTGQLPGDRLRAAVAGPRGLDVWVGVPAEHHARCADVLWDGPAPVPPGHVHASDLAGDDLMRALTYANPTGYSSIGLVNTAGWRSAQVPSTNAHASARGLAGVYQGLLGPDPLLSPALLAEATRVQSTGPCPILGDDVAFGLGFTPTSARRPLGPNPRAFGHFGTGGALGFADPDAGVAFGYVMNHVIPRWQSTRNRALIDALYTALAT